MQENEPTAVFVGDEMLAAQCAAEAQRRGIDVTLVASHSPVVLAEAASLGIQTADLGVTPLAEVLPESTDVLFSVAFQHIIDARVLDRVGMGINFHDGLLPAYGGLNVTTWSILNGEPEHGVTWHVMEQLADRGAVILERRFDLVADETAFSLNARCYEAGLSSFGDVADQVARRDVQQQAQAADGEATRRMYRRTERPVVFVDGTEPAAGIVRSIRAMDVGPRAVRNMGAARLWTGQQTLLTLAARVDAASTLSPSEVRAVAGELHIGTVDGAVVVTALSDAPGNEVSADAAAAEIGSRVPSLDETHRQAIVAADPALSRQERPWLTALTEIRIATPDLIAPMADGAAGSIDVAPAATSVADRTDAAVAGVALWLDAVSGAGSTGVVITDTASRAVCNQLPGLHSPMFDASIDAELDVSSAAVLSAMSDRRTAALERGPFFADLIGRSPDLRGRLDTFAVAVHLELDDPAEAALDESTIAIAVAADGRVGLRHRLHPAVADRVSGQIAAAISSVENDADIADVAFLSDGDRAILDALSDTATDRDESETLDGLFVQQCAARSGELALSCGDQQLTYAELEAEVASMARLLVDAGVGNGATVGIALERSVDMVVSLFATLSIGAHYLPLDPTYPSERLALMVEDSGAQVVVARPGADVLAADSNVRFVDPAARSNTGDAVPQPAHGAGSLAYVIYTSGSTGRPKGVELEHRQVTNFFVGMDEVIGADDPGVWLAVTSLSFDISVLELVWTLTRGFHVVVSQSSGFVPVAASAAPVVARSTRQTTMSLFYFAADASQATNGYRLLQTSARWADERGFEALWTPERHFHDFGAPYPNPSVIGAALAAITENIGIRAGSVVIPLHSPIRIAEEWAVVDNLSGGRVGLSFASGWQPNDFVLNPSAYATSRESMPGLIDTVSRLWRGETVELPGHDGAPVPVSTLPRPVQPELPVWITSAGSPASFERAGMLGRNILTHLVGQTVEKLTENIAAYRAAWTAAGHDGEGQVTLMLHTYLGADGDAARETARAPLKGYLGTAVGLLKDLASAFPTFHRAGADADEAFRSLTDDEMSQLLDLATDRYLSTAGLFGTVDDATAMAQAVVDAGVDELACLIDFGIDEELVVDGLDLLETLHDRIRSDAFDSTPAVGTGTDEAPSVETFASLVKRHGVTHFQCTPSLASMLIADPNDREALRSVRHMMVGGEALPVALGNELRSLLPDRFTNMYGPTETTIWSLTHEISDVPDSGVPIGVAIANTSLLVVDGRGRRVPVGVSGELLIGGDGVARGYHERPDLNDERFPTVSVAASAAGSTSGRMYRTGDIVSVDASGVVAFGGRADHQVKIRGHRIELSEIETRLDGLPGVARSVVVATTDGDAELVAYATLRRDEQAAQTGDDLREALAEQLPDAMVPSTIVILDDLPLTPNGKIDRARLPAIDVARADVGAFEGAGSDVEAAVGSLWQQQLGQRVGLDDNFFEAGGHSLMAVKIFRELGTESPRLALTDVFRYPTVRTFAAHLVSLSGDAPDDSTSSGPQVSGTDRGAMRRRARRRGPGAS